MTGTISHGVSSTAGAESLAGLLTELGIEPIVHGGGTKSSMGGASMSAEVADIYRAALDVFVPMEELLAAVGDAAGRLLGTDSAAVVAGAASGCVLGAAAIRSLADPDVAVPSFVTQRRHYGRYTYLYEQAGCSVAEVGTMNDCPISVYSDAIDRNTVGIAWLEGPGIRSAGATLAEVCDLAAERSLPVLVDAAAMAFPVERIQGYVDAGATLVVISGGKLLRGPQASGFVLGRRDVVQRMRELGFPHQGIGRAHKVPKEVALAAYAALRGFVKQDFAATMTDARTRASRVAAELAESRIDARVDFSSRHALPAVVIEGLRRKTGELPSVLSARLLGGQPRVFLPYDDALDELYVEFASLAPEQDVLVLKRVVAEVVGGGGPAGPQVLQR